MKPDISLNKWEEKCETEYNFMMIFSLAEKKREKGGKILIKMYGNFPAYSLYIPTLF